MMRPAILSAAALLAGASSLVLAQDAPADLLPPVFSDPAPAPSPAPTRSPRPTQPAPSPNAPAPTPVAPVLQPGEVVQELPDRGRTGGTDETTRVGTGIDLKRLPTLRELESMTTDQLDEVFGLKPKVDIPAAQQRSLQRVGVLDMEEGGLPTYSLANQPAALVRAALVGTQGPLVSRWGHILLRRALASRLEAPAGMDPAEFAALRAGLLNRVGEFDVARALVQDIDTANYSSALTNAALAAYIGSADILGSCPAVRLGRSTRDDAEWRMLGAICNAHAGEPTNANNDLRRLMNSGRAERIDALLAQRYAGAAGDGRRSVTIEWNNVEELTPWRASLARAVGEEIPEGLSGSTQPWYALSGATAPMLTAAERIPFAQVAAQHGILSSQAMIDLYAMAFLDESGAPADAAQELRTAYVASTAAARLEAIRGIWNRVDGDIYGQQVLTAFAAARVMPSQELTADAAPLLASMLSAGLDRDAARWSSVVEAGSPAWGILMTGLTRDQNASSGQLDRFVENDETSRKLRSRMLLAGLAGLDRIGSSSRRSLEDELGVQFDRRTRWTQAIAAAAQSRNQAMVVLLAGLGMQGDGWDRMTASHLYQIVRSLKAVGLEAEARMIAAEAVARA